MVKAYLRYNLARTVGVIASTNFCAALYDVKGDLVFAPSLHDVLVWHLHRNEVVRRLSGGKSNVTALAISKDGRSIAVGFVTHPPGPCVHSLATTPWI